MCHFFKLFILLSPLWAVADVSEFPSPLGARPLTQKNSYIRDSTPEVYWELLENLHSQDVRKQLASVEQVLTMDKLDEERVIFSHMAWRAFSSRSALVRAVSLKVLEKHKHVHIHLVRGAFMNACFDSEFSIRLYALKTLFALDEKPSIYSYRKAADLLLDSNIEVQKTAVNILSRGAPYTDAYIKQKLTAALHSSFPIIQKNVIRLIVRNPPPSSSGDLLKRRLLEISTPAFPLIFPSSMSEVRQTAVHALGVLYIGDAEVQERLYQLARSDLVFYVRLEALRALSRVHSAASQENWTEGLKDLAVRMRSLEYFKAVEQRFSLLQLIHLNIESDFEKTRILAAQLLRGMPQNSAWVQQALMDALYDPSPAVYTLALGGLKRLKTLSPAAVHALASQADLTSPSCRTVFADKSFIKRNVF